MTARSGAGSDPVGHGMARRDFLKVGVGFSLMAAVAGALGSLSGCGDAVKAPAKNFVFLQNGDIALFTALAPAVVIDLVSLDSAQHAARIADVLHNLDDTCGALDLAAGQELRKLLDLLAIGPLRYLLTGVGAWNEASVDTLQAFLTRWRGSRFATLNAGGNVLVKLISASYYVLPASWPASGYPGPLAQMYRAVNS
ncbi:MAG: hypothetical protein ACOYNZ_03645 [Rhodoferax sp.]